MGFKRFREEVLKTLEGLDAGEADLEEPPEGMGDLAFPCFRAADGPPEETAQEAAEDIDPSETEYIKKVETSGPYINFYANWEGMASEIFSSWPPQPENRGEALVEHTSINPNASPHVGRARNAILGDTLVRVLRAHGYDTEVHYYVNDMGKQIALLVWAAGDETPAFDELLDEYVEANRRMEEDEGIEEEVFQILKRFEEGEEEIVQRFHDIVDTCIEGQKEILSQLNIEYDHFDRESDFFPDSKEVLEELKELDRVRTDDEGRNVMDLEGLIDSDSDVVVLTRSDGTTLYMTRDVAYSRWKGEQADDLNLVVLGEDQKLYHRQLSAVMKHIGLEPPESIHYSFVSLKDSQMSTREGNVVLLEDFMEEVKEKAVEEIKKRHDLSDEEAEERAEKISVAAVRYGMVRVSPERGITFDPAEAVKLEGNTGPYLQYTYARAHSILEKAGGWDDEVMEPGEHEKRLLRKISKLEDIVRDASEERRPHLVATYTYELATLFNKFYEECPVIQSDDPVRSYRLGLVEATAETLEKCLDMLGIDTLQEM